jgi:hypothetical protein
LSAAERPLRAQPLPTPGKFMDATTPRATASAQTGDVERSSRTSGRTTRTKGVSLRPGELEDAKVVEELTGVRNLSSGLGPFLKSSG